MEFRKMDNENNLNMLEKQIAFFYKLHKILYEITFIRINGIRVC